MTIITQQQLPAILIGGPPHSGKSVFINALSRKLYAINWPHYLLSANPDGEGRWSNEISQDLAKALRQKGSYSQQFIDRAVYDIHRRETALLVDVGGRPQAYQKAVFDACTHAILVVSESAPPDNDLAYWRKMMVQADVTIIAELHSNLEDQDHLFHCTPIVSGKISNLERGTTIDSATLRATVGAINCLFPISNHALKSRQLRHFPPAKLVDLAILTTEIASKGTWEPKHLPLLLEKVPFGKPLAIFGRAPNWIYAALAVHALPAACWQFDARLGWVQTPHFPLVDESNGQSQVGWQSWLKEWNDGQLLCIETASQYLDFRQPERLPIPRPRPLSNLYINGKMPMWAFAAIARTAAPHTTRLAVYQPQLEGCVIINGSEIGRIIKMSRKACIDS